MYYFYGYLLGVLTIFLILISSQYRAKPWYRAIGMVLPAVVWPFIILALVIEKSIDAKWINRWTNKWTNKRILLASISIILIFWIVGQFIPEDSILPSFKEYFQ